MSYVDELKDIELLMINGNWSSAQEKFKKLNCSAKEFDEFLTAMSIPDLENYIRFLH